MPCWFHAPAIPGFSGGAVSPAPSHAAMADRRGGNICGLDDGALRAQLRQLGVPSPGLGVERVC